MSDWSQYKVSPIESNVQTQFPQAEENLPLGNQSEVPQIQETQDWSQFSVKPKEEKSFGTQFVEGANKLIARGIEAGYGIPGEIESILRPIAAHQPKGPGLLGKISEKRIFPTIDELRQLSKEGRKGELEPENEAERIGGELLQDYIFTPGGPAKKIILSGVGKAVEEGMKFFGASDDTASKTKAATTFVASFVGKKNVKDFYKSEYQKASSSIPQGAKVETKKFVDQLSSLEKNIQSGVDIPAKGPALGVIEQLKKKSASGGIDVKELDDAYHNINDFLFDRKNLPAKSEKWLRDTRKIVGEELNRYGVKNPEYIKSFRDANAAYAGVAQGQKATDWIKKNKKAAFVSAPIAFLAGLHYLGPLETAERTAEVASLYGVASAYDLGSRIFSNKTLFHYYTKALAAAAKENAPQFLHNMNKVDKGLREMNTETSHFVDLMRR